MTLYEIREDMQAVLDLDEEYIKQYGISHPNLREQFESLVMSEREKIGQISRAYKNLKAEQKALHEEIEKLKAKHESISKRVSSTKNYLMFAIGEGNKFKDTVTSIFWTKRKSIECEKPELLPRDLQKITIEADKTAIQNEIDAGVIIEGVSIIEKYSMTVR